MVTIGKGFGSSERSRPVPVPVEPKIVPDEVLDKEIEGFESPGPT